METKIKYIITTNLSNGTVWESAVQHDTLASARKEKDRFKRNDKREGYDPISYRIIKRTITEEVVG